MPRPLAKNRLEEWEKSALSQAIQRYIFEHGGYASLVRNAEVRQPVVSLALHRRLVTRTDAVKRLFEFLKIVGPASAPEKADERDREQHLLGLLVGLSDGSALADRRLETVL